MFKHERQVSRGDYNCTGSTAVLSQPALRLYANNPTSPFIKSLLTMWTSSAGELLAPAITNDVILLLPLRSSISLLVWAVSDLITLRDILRANSFKQRPGCKGDYGSIITTAGTKNMRNKLCSASQRPRDSQATLSARLSNGLGPASLFHVAFLNFP